MLTLMELRDGEILLIPSAASRAGAFVYTSSASKFSWCCSRIEHKLRRRASYLGTMRKWSRLCCILGFPVQLLERDPSF